MRDVLQQAETYKRTYAIVGRAHYIAGDRALAPNRWLGIPVIIITAVVGTTIFGTLNENPDTRLRICRSSFRWQGWSYPHCKRLWDSLRLQGQDGQTQYRAIKRRLDFYVLSSTQMRRLINGQRRLRSLKVLIASWRLAPEGPNLADKYLDRAEKDYEAENRRTNAYAVPADVQRA